MNFVGVWNHLERVRVIKPIGMMPKERSLLMKILNIVLFFIPGFMSRFHTTIGNTIYEASDRGLSTETFLHEVQHIYDSQGKQLVYGLMYLFPQVLALLALLAISYSNWWLMSLLFLAPIPAPGRAWIERRGYLMQAAVVMWLHGIELVELADYVKPFVDSTYYFMWPFGCKNWDWFSDSLDKILCGIYPNELFREVHYYIKEAGLEHQP